MLASNDGFGIAGGGTVVVVVVVTDVDVLVEDELQHKEGAETKEINARKINFSQALTEAKVVPGRRTGGAATAAAGAGRGR